MDGAVRFRPAGDAPSRDECRLVSGRPGYVNAHSGLAEIFLSLRLGLANPDSGTAEPVVWPSAFVGVLGAGRLAAFNRTFPWSADLRFLLGDVELLFVSQMGL